MSREFEAYLDGEPLAFQAYARRCGAATLKEVMVGLERSIDASSVESYRRGMTAARPRLERIASALDTEFGCPQYLRDIRLKADAAPERGVAIHRELERLRQRDDADPAAEAGIRPLTESAERFEALGYRRGVMFVEEHLSAESDKIGDRIGRREHMRAAAGIARELGETYMLCQYLGRLGDSYEDLGAPDSAMACYQEGLAVALDRRFPDQAARLMTFVAHMHAMEGRLALATEWIHQALRTCRGLGGSADESRFLATAMEHFAAMQCWDVVERLLERAPILFRELEQSSADPLRLRLRSVVTRVEAQLKLARGDFEGASALFLKARRGEGRSSPQHQVILLEEWTQGLAEAGRMEEALPLVEEGLRISDRTHNDRYGRTLAIRHARVLFGLGRHREAAAAIADFDRRTLERNDTPSDQAVEREVLTARLLALAGDRPAAREALVRSLERLRAHARRLDAGPLGYLALAAMDDVRFAAHEIAVTDAAAGYRFELQWRALVRELGASTRSAPVAPAAWSFERAPGDPPQVPTDATHLVFMMGPRVIVRWNATSSGVRRDTLPLAPAECARRVDRVLAALDRGGAPGTGPAASTAADLRWFARALLPDDVLSVGASLAPRRLLISADGPLERVPFEALDRSERGAYRPLALDFDIARLRSPAPGASDAARGAPVILADPVASDEVRRRFSSLGPLPASDREVNAARSAWEDARVFRGEDARRASVLAAMRQAPGIHVAAHLVRDPDLPFSPFVPLARDTSEGPARDYLEIADVRALDLSGCGLAVISTCSSGAPYAASRRLGPSFGDAFVDAGAACVVQAAWDVDDARAAPLIERFLAERRRVRDPIRALGAARRAAIRGELGPSDARAWAAWVVSVAPAWSQVSTPSPGIALRMSR